MTKQTINLCNMQIVLPAAPTAVESSAALELQEHLLKMCGVETTIAKEDKKATDGNFISIGATEYAASSGVEYPDNAFGEGWAIKATEGNLILCGSKGRGVLYAVYHLLEDVFGVHWWSLWEESVPTLSSACVPADYESSGVPAMEYRDVFTWPLETKSRFAVRNRLNGWAMPIETEFGGMEYFGQPAHVHTFDRYFPEEGDKPGDERSEYAKVMNPDNESYFQTHPEWYAITARGKRVPKVLCMSDEGLQQAMVDKLLKSIEFSYAEADAAGKARPRYFDLSPADMIGECNCPRCAASISAHGSSGHQLRFVNKIAAKVKEIYPEVIVETLSYWSYLIPPKDDTKPSEDVLVRYCNNRMDILHDIRHPNNRHYFEGLKSWLKLCGKGKLYLWDYGVFYNPNGIVPSMYKLEENFRTFAELGVNGYFLEMEHSITTDMWDMKVWMSTKLMEDPTLDQNVLMNTFLGGYYGAAGEHIRRYLDAAHKVTEEYGASYDYCNASLIHAAGFTVEDILFYDRCFADALAAVGQDPVLLRRVRHARLCLDRVIVENFDKWTTEAAAMGLTMPLDKAAVGRRIYETLKEQVAMRGEWDYTGAEVMKLYEKYLPDYVAPDISAEMAEEKRLAKLHGSKDAWKGASPVIVPESELAQIPEDKLYVFTAHPDFSEKLQEDLDSPLGASSRYDIAHMWKARIISKEQLEGKWAVADGDNEKCIPLATYTGESDPVMGPISNVWGTIRASDILADGKYHLYKFSDVVAVAKGGKGLFHMFREWAMAIFSLCVELDHLEGKNTDCYLSMKVSGDVSCTDLDNLPVYCIDKVIVADKS